jgi:hypothetical protein
MEKNGEVSIGNTPCDICSKPAVQLISRFARCTDHSISEVKAASVEIPIKAFTAPLEETNGHIQS